MKKLKKQKLIFIIFILFVILIVPLLIHLLYHFEFLKPSWSSGDMLQYYGSIIGALLAIVGVFITLEHNRKENKKNLKQNVRPYLETSIIELDTFSEIDAVFEVEKTVCFYDKNMTQTLTLSNKLGKDCIMDFRYKNTDYEDYFVFNYTIENIGLGSAINLEIKLDSKPIAYNLNIANGNSFNIYFFIYKGYLSSDSKLVFELTYSDIFEENSYKQTEKLNVVHGLHNYHITRNPNDKISKQEIINN